METLARNGLSLGLSFEFHPWEKQIRGYNVRKTTSKLFLQVRCDLFGFGSLYTVITKKQSEIRACYPSMKSPTFILSRYVGLL